MHIRITEDSALIVVDVQNDFTPGGALPVPDGDRIVMVLNAYTNRFVRKKRPVFFTRDWHPLNHISFQQYGGQWPPHCIMDSKGAEFHSELFIPQDAVIISKGTSPNKEAYSGFEGTDLSVLLKGKHVKRVFIGGLATDYCVKSTVIDAIRAGFEVVFLADASSGVEVKAGDSENAIMEMLGEGAIKICIEDII